MTPRYPLVLDSIAIVCFTVGAVLAVFDIEVCVSDIERTNLHIIMTIEYTRNVNSENVMELIFGMGTIYSTINKRNHIIFFIVIQI